MSSGMNIFKQYVAIPLQRARERKKIPILCFILQVVLLRINGEVDVCLGFGSWYSLQNSEHTEEISDLLGEVSNEIKKVIEKSTLGRGQSSTYTYFHLNLSHSAITLEGDLTDGSVIIDKPIIVNNLTMVSKGFEIFNLTFPSVYINGTYDFSGYVGRPRLFDIYGEGDFYLQLTNMSIAAVSGLKINSSSLCIPITMNVYVKDYQNDFVNFMNGDEELEPLLNGAMQAIVPDAVRIFFREGADYEDQYIQSIIDNILNRNSLEPLFKLLYLLSSNTDELI